MVRGRLPPARMSTNGRRDRSAFDPALMSRAREPGDQFSPGRGSVSCRQRGRGARTLLRGRRSRPRLPGGLDANRLDPRSQGRTGIGTRGVFNRPHRACRLSRRALARRRCPGATRTARRSGRPLAEVSRIRPPRPWAEQARQRLRAMDEATRLVTESSDGGSH